MELGQNTASTVLAWGLPRYRNMCHFYSVHLFAVMAQLGFEAFLRVDDDVFMLMRADYDPFRRIQHPVLLPSLTVIHNTLGIITPNSYGRYSSLTTVCGHGFGVTFGMHLLRRSMIGLHCPCLLGSRAVSYTHLRAHETEADL
eukprot:6137560-Amphidinium_carterae.2